MHSYWDERQQHISSISGTGVSHSGIHDYSDSSCTYGFDSRFRHTAHQPNNHNFHRPLQRSRTAIFEFHFHVFPLNGLTLFSNLEDLEQEQEFSIGADMEKSHQSLHFFIGIIWIFVFDVVDQ